MSSCRLSEQGRILFKKVQLAFLSSSQNLVHSSLGSSAVSHLLEKVEKKDRVEIIHRKMWKIMAIILWKIYPNLAINWIRIYKKSLIHFSIFVATHSKPFLVHSYSSFHTFGNGKPFNVTSFKIGHVLTNQISLDNKNKKLVWNLWNFLLQTFFF